MHVRVRARRACERVCVEHTGGGGGGVRGRARGAQDKQDGRAEQTIPLPGRRPAHKSRQAATFATVPNNRRSPAAVVPATRCPPIASIPARPPAWGRKPRDPRCFFNRPY